MTVYLDHNATSFMIDDVRIAMSSLNGMALNASSIHRCGGEAKKLLEKARHNVCCAINASDEFNIVFTASGTEANNLAIRGMDIQSVTTSIEHLSVLNVIGEGNINVDNNGLVNINHLQQILKAAKQPVLVSVIMANNETGVVQDIKTIAHIVHEHGSFIHTDASQAIGRLPIDIRELEVDLITLCAHKCGGPLGVGALAFKKDLPMMSHIKGGGQEMRFRAGTQNIPAIHGFGVVCEDIDNIINDFQACERLRDLLDSNIMNISPQSIVFSSNVKRLPNTTCFTMPLVESQTQVIHFDLNGFAVSAGSACSSGRVDIPYVQMSMGYPKEIAETAIRVSLNANNTIDEINAFTALWQQLYLKTRSGKKVC